jgi:hypothetical protein
MKYEGRSVRQVVKVLDPSPYLELMDRRFGIPPETFAPWLFFQPKRDSIWMVSRELLLPGRPDQYTLGMPFFRIRMRWPRPATAAVFKFGQLAKKNVLELEDDELAAMVYHRPLELEPERASALDGNGYVILRHRELSLGLGYYRPHRDPEDGDGEGRLTSLCPKAWTQRLGIEPPPKRPPAWVEGPG